MRELIEIIYEVGPTNQVDKLLLLAIVALARDKGHLRAEGVATLARLVGLSEKAVQRRLKRLDAADWIFYFGRAACERSEIYLDIKRLCSRALIAGVGQPAASWAEKQLGIVPFPIKMEQREALRK